MSTTISLIGLIAALAVMGTLIAKGFNYFISIWFAVAIIAVTNGLGLYDTFINTFLGGMFGYYQSYFFAFILASLVGSLAMASGASEVIGRWMVKAFGRHAFLGFEILVCVLSYFGVQPALCLITLLPIGFTVFAANNIPRRFILAATFSFGYAPLFVAPGSPAPSSNLIATQALGVPLTAGFINGWIGSILLFTLQFIAFSKIIKRAQARGEGFEALEGDTFANLEDDGEKRISLLEAFLPIVAMGVMLNLKDVLSFKVEFGYFLTLVIAVIIYGRHLKLKATIKVLSEGLYRPFDVTLTIGTMVGLGTVVTTLPVFEVIKESLFLIPGNPLISAAIAINVVAFITASSTTPLLILTPTLGAEYVAMGADPAALARVLCFGSIVFDSMPYAGAMNSLMRQCGLNHKQTYGHIFILNVVMPLITLIVVIALFILFPNLP